MVNEDTSAAIATLENPKEMSGKPYLRIEYLDLVEELKTACDIIYSAG